MMGLLFQFAAELTREMKIDYEAAIEAEITAAEEACNGFTVTRAGQREGITTDTVFRGAEATAYKWATPELVNYWISTPRLTLAAFEARWVKLRYDEWALIEKSVTR